MMSEINDKLLFVKYLTEFNSKVNSVITGQMSYLSSKERISLCILIRPDLAEQMLGYAFPGDVIKQQQLLSYFAVQQALVCEVYKMPVYVSTKLSKSILQVVGEVEWK